jgi:cobalt-precorrin-5B (C1)-methyltransferase
LCIIFGLQPKHLLVGFEEKIELAGGTKRLKSGFTTGTAAAAAAKGALSMLIDGHAPETVSIRLLTGDWIRIPILACTPVSRDTIRCAVIKDAGDDPDITHGAEIGVVLRLDRQDLSGRVTISGGAGVGTVTKPGLAIDIGQAAITNGPKKMITEAVAQVRKSCNVTYGVHIEVFVKDGRTLAQKTLNRRLGIVGGISILGTTGVVRPLSHASYIATIDAALSVAKSAGVKEVVLTTGRRSERFSMLRWKHLPEEAFIQIGDFFKSSLEKTAKHHFERAMIAVFFGKAVKMAQGVPHTHAAKARLTLAKLSQWTLEVSQNRSFAEKIAAAHTARHALTLILPKYPQVIAQVGGHLTRAAQTFAGPEVKIQGVIYDFEGNIIYDSKGDAR